MSPVTARLVSVRSSIFIYVIIGGEITCFLNSLFAEPMAALMVVFLHAVAAESVVWVL